ncbi:MAG: AMP-binding protein [Eubacterium sp.]|nr:AMP-binding protein [Eubacterium sp.]
MNREALWKMFEYAYNQSALYRDKALCEEIDITKIIKERDWSTVPLIEKTELISNNHKLVSDEYMGYVVTGNVIKSHTSGSTGECLNVFWSKEDYLHSLMSLWLDRRRHGGVLPGDRLCNLSSSSADGALFRRKKNQMIVSKDMINEDTINEVMSGIEEFDPVWMVLHPSFASVLCRELKSSGSLNSKSFKSIKYIELTGEHASENLKQELRKLFSCEVRSHYGSIEVSSIGYEYGDDYMLYDNTTFLEVLDDEGRTVEDGVVGNLYVTSLHNHVMPIVRYGLGDRGYIYTREVDGRKCRLVHLEKYRKNDYIVLKDGTRLIPDGLMKPVEAINHATENSVLQVVIEQDEEVIRVCAVLDDDFEEYEFEVNYMHFLPDVIKSNFSISFEYKSVMFPDERTGKNGWFKRIERKI